MRTTASSLPPTPGATEPALLLALRTQREQTLTRLYQRAFPMVRRYVLRNGGRADDAQDIFHDALVVFYEQAVAGKLALSAAPETYLVAVCRNLWLRELERLRRNPQTDLSPDHANLPDEAQAASEPAAESVLTYVEQLGERCRSILLSFYYFQQPLADIARTHQYGSVRSATVQKFKCLERLRGAVQHLRAELLHLHA